MIDTISNERFNSLLRGRTGWHNARDKLKAMLGSDIVDRTKQIWGVDAEGEINGVYKYTGYPGVSDFSLTR